MKSRVLASIWAVLCTSACAPETASTLGSATQAPTAGASYGTAGRAGTGASALSEAGRATIAAGAGGPGVGVAGPGVAGASTPVGRAAAAGSAAGVAGRTGLPQPTAAGSASGAAGQVAAGGSPQTGTAGASSSGGKSAADVCTRWKADRADVSEGAWTGNVASCEPGDMSATGRANALRVLNLYRWLADLPAVETDPAMDKQAQACSLLQRANNSLSHMPPSTWTCYMAEGATAAGRCNISTGPAVSSVDGYMIDPGNDTTIGHRRWILSNSFGPTGIGSTDMHSCLMTFGKNKLGRPWMAWPSPGVIPVQAMTSRWLRMGVDVTGWTVQSDTINLAMAQVTVMSDGAALPVAVQQLGAGYGSRYAISFKPMGWTSTAGKKYAVSVSGTAQPIQYEVEFADCK